MLAMKSIRSLIYLGVICTGATSHADPVVVFQNRTQVVKLSADEKDQANTSSAPLLACDSHHEFTTMATRNLSDEPYCVSGKTWLKVDGDLPNGLTKSFKAVVPGEGTARFLYSVQRIGDLVTATIKPHPSAGPEIRYSVSTCPNSNRCVFEFLGIVPGTDKGEPAIADAGDCVCAIL